MLKTYTRNNTTKIYNRQKLKEKKTKKESNKLMERLFSRLGLQNTSTESLLMGKAPSKSVLDMTLNNLMVRLQ